MILRHIALSPGALFGHLLQGLMTASTSVDRRQPLLARKASQAIEVDPATLAHELSAPVSAINVLTNMLSDPTASPETQREVTAAIHAELRILKSLIEDVERLPSAPTSRLRIAPRPVQVLSLMSPAALYARVLDPDVNVTVDCPPGIAALADPQRIQQVLRNLVGNAVRYSAPGTPIVISASRVLGRIRIQVVDHGPGIPPGLLPVVFEKRVRGPQSGSAPVPGKGLGLSICREIVEAHGGQLQVQSSVHGGTTFWFELRDENDPASYR